MSATMHAPASRWLLPAVLFALMLPLHIGLLPWAFDDAFIHLRVASNLAAGNGPYYNPGSAVNASSAPAWTLLLALLRLVGGSPVWVVVLNALLTVSGAALFVDVVRRLSGSKLGSPFEAGLMLAYCGAVHPSSAGLMEIPAALAVLGLALRGWASGSPWSFAWFAVAGFFRFELGVFAALFLLETTLSGRCERKRAWLAALVGGLPFVIYLLLAFGTILPHTALAKSRVYALSYTDSWRLLLDFGVPGGVLALRSVLRWAGIPLAVVLLAAAFSSRDRAGDRTRPPLWPLGLGALSIPVVYVLTRALVFPWYVPLIAVPASVLLASVIASSARLWMRAALIALVFVPFALELVPSVVAVFANRPDAYRYFAVNARVRKYREIGARLDDAYPGARLMSSEVGGLGDTFRGEILDGAGLITPEALRYHPMAVPGQRSSGLYGAIPAAWVEQAEPELIVSMDVFAEELLRSGVLERYRHYREPIYVDADLRAGAPQVLWGSTSINVWVRDDLPPFGSRVDRQGSRAR